MPKSITYNRFRCTDTWCFLSHFSKVSWASCTLWAYQVIIHWQHHAVTSKVYTTECRKFWSEFVRWAWCAMALAAQQVVTFMTFCTVIFCTASPNPPHLLLKWGYSLFFFFFFPTIFPGIMSSFSVLLSRVGSLNALGSMFLISNYFSNLNFIVKLNGFG